MPMQNKSVNQINQKSLNYYFITCSVMFINTLVLFSTHHNLNQNDTYIFIDIYII